VLSELYKRWKFRKANQKKYSDIINHLAKDLLSPNTSYVDKVYQDFCNSIITAAKRANPRGCRNRYKSCWDAKCEDLVCRYAKCEDLVGSVAERVKAPFLWRPCDHALLGGFEQAANSVIRSQRNNRKTRKWTSPKRVRIRPNTAPPSLSRDRRIKKRQTNLYQAFLRASRGETSDTTSTALLSRLDEKRKGSWSEAVESIDFTHSSRLAWTTINNFTGRSTKNHRPCPITANSMTSQLVKNETYKTKDHESDRLVNKEVSDLWKIPAPKDKCIYGEFTSDEFALALQQIKPLKDPQVLTPYAPSMT